MLSSHHHLIRVESDSKLLKQKPWESAQAVSTSFKCIFFPPLILGPVPQKRGVLKQVRATHTGRQCAANVGTYVCVQTASDASLLYPSQLITVPSLCHYCPAKKLLYGPSEGLRGLGMCQQVSCGGVSTIRDLGGFSDAVWESANNYHHHPNPGSILGLGHLCIPQLNLSLGHGHPRCHAMLWYTVRRAKNICSAWARVSC